jgi:hypothetical protein
LPVIILVVRVPFNVNTGFNERLVLDIIGYPTPAIKNPAFGVPGIQDQFLVQVSYFEIGWLDVTGKPPAFTKKSRGNRLIVYYSHLYTSIVNY